MSTVDRSERLQPAAPETTASVKKAHLVGPDVLEQAVPVQDVNVLRDHSNMIPSKSLQKSENRFFHVQTHRQVQRLIDFLNEAWPDQPIPMFGQHHESYDPMGWGCG